MCRLSLSLEASLLEKGEIASCLNSTQDEVAQMKTGIEKLQVRIESDERKKKKMGELLKGSSYSTLAILELKCLRKSGCGCICSLKIKMTLSVTAAQRKCDSLQDKIDALEREREEAEQNLEEAVLQVCCLPKKLKTRLE